MVAKRLDELVSLLADHLQETRPGARRARAIAIFGMMMGTLQLARAAPSRRQASETLAGGIKAAIALGKKP
jgi:TetR/AcrR family transcriptional repressor of nem operon